MFQGAQIDAFAIGSFHKKVICYPGSLLSRVVFAKKTHYFFVYSKKQGFLYTLDATNNYRQSVTITQEFSVTRKYRPN